MRTTALINGRRGRGVWRAFLHSELRMARANFDHDIFFDRDRFAVDVCRAVAPLTDGVHGRRNQRSWTADRLDVCYFAIRSDGRAQMDRASLKLGYDGWSESWIGFCDAIAEVRTILGVTPGTGPADATSSVTNGGAP